MAYTPTTWKAGDVVTVSKLNKIEQGITAVTEEAERTDLEPLIVIFLKDDSRERNRIFYSNVRSSEITAALQAGRSVDMYLKINDRYIEKINYFWDSIDNTFAPGQEQMLSNTGTAMYFGISDPHINVYDTEYLSIDFTEPQEQQGR